VRATRLVLTALAVVLLGCAGGAECMCTNADHLYIEFDRPVAGSTIRVCDGTRCATGTINHGTRPEGDVRRSRLPAWSADHDSKLSVAVLGESGAAILTATDLSSHKHHNCCGDYYVVPVG
jgi:hypothetical protein